MCRVKNSRSYNSGGSKVADYIVAQKSEWKISLQGGEREDKYWHQLGSFGISGELRYIFFLQATNPVNQR